MQLTDGDAKRILLAHARKEMRNGFYSLLELNSRWDPQTKSMKLVALVDLVTPSPAENADKFMGKLMEWEAKIVETKTSHHVVLPTDIKTAIFISMALGR